MADLTDDISDIDLQVAVSRLRRIPHKVLDERESLLILEALGVPVLPTQVILDPAEPLSLAYPVSLTPLAREVPRQQLATFRVGKIEGLDQLYTAMEHLSAMTDAVPIDGIMVMEEPETAPVIALTVLLDDDNQLHVGVVTDPPVITADAPLDLDGTWSVIGELRQHPEVVAASATTSLDLAALTDALEAFSALAHHKLGVESATLSPLLVFEDGGCAVAQGAQIRRTHANR